MYDFIYYLWFIYNECIWCWWEKTPEIYTKRKPRKKSPVWLPSHYSCCSPLYQLRFWLIYPLGKSIILVISESLTTPFFIDFNSLSIYMYIYIYIIGSTRVEHSCNCSIAAFYGGFLFFFWPTDCISLDFFQLVWRSWPFLFFLSYDIFSFFPRAVFRDIFISWRFFFFFFFFPGNRECW